MTPTAIAGFEVAERHVERGASWAVSLHRFVSPRDWPAALELVPEEHRAAADQYLRSIAKRMRAARAA